MEAKILFVDDDEHILEAYQRALRKKVQIDTASSGAEGIHMLEQRGPYAAVVADMQMPGMNGGEFLARVKEQAPDTVRLMLTGHADTQTAITAVNQGNVFQFLTKPCPVETLLESLTLAVDKYRQATTKNERILVEPIKSQDGKPWTLELGAEILVLLNADGAHVIDVLREEAARYLHFDYDLRYGRTVAVDVIPGLKSYVFRCDKQQITALQTWLPHKPPERIRKEIRLSGIGVGLFGILHFILAQSVFWGWGVLLLAVGLAGIALPKRALHAINSAAMLIVGLADLVSASPLHIQGLQGLAMYVPILVGGTLILWVAHQIAMFSPNHQLRYARAVRDKGLPFLPAHSRLVRGITRSVAWVALIFAVYAAWVVAVALYAANPVEKWNQLMAMLPDIAVFGIGSALLAATALLMTFRRRPPYLEAKVAAQALISLVLLAFWSLLLNLDLQAPIAFFGHIFSSSLVIFERPYAWGSLIMFDGAVSKEFVTYARPYVWGTLIACVMIFDFWFTRAVDRELESERDVAVE